MAAFLAEKDLGSFSASNGQRKTKAHATIVASGMTGDEWLDDELSVLGYPDAVRTDRLTAMVLKHGIEKAGNVRRKISPTMGRIGYVLYRSESKDGRWKIGDKKVTVYVKRGVHVNPVEDLKDESF